MDSPRVAVYFAPDVDSALWKTASWWLGRDAARSVNLDPPPLNGISAAEWHEIVKFPRHYGFHATLKPPFRLRPGSTLGELVSLARHFAETRTPFTLPPLKLSRLGNFLALTESSHSAQLHSLAADCVRHFEPFRATPSEQEVDARKQGVRNPRQLELIDRWGYPYVLDEWQFHMTLTSSLADQQTREKTEHFLAKYFAPLTAQPIAIDSISLFVQDGREHPFHLLARLPFPA